MEIRGELAGLCGPMDSNQREIKSQREPDGGKRGTWGDRGPWGWDGA